MHSISHLYFVSNFLTNLFYIPITYFQIIIIIIIIIINIIITIITTIITIIT
jgi:hypothetical protein